MQVDAIIDYLVRSRDMVQGQLGVDGGRQRLRLRRCLRAADPRPRPSWDVPIAISISSQALTSCGRSAPRGNRDSTSWASPGGLVARWLRSAICVCTSRRMGRSSFSKSTSLPRTLSAASSKTGCSRGIRAAIATAEPAFRSRPRYHRAYRPIFLNRE